MTTIVREEVIQENGTALTGFPAEQPVERREYEQVVTDDYGEQRKRVVDDVGARRRSLLAKVKQFIWLGSGMLMAAIGLRFLLKLIAANPENPFAWFVYRVTDLFVWPFMGLTITPAANGMVLEINSLVAILFYLVVTFGFVKLLDLIFTPSSTRSVSVYEREVL